MQPLSARKNRELLHVLHLIRDAAARAGYILDANPVTHRWTWPMTATEQILVWAGALAGLGAVPALTLLLGITLPTAWLMPLVLLAGAAGLTAGHTAAHPPPQELKHRWERVSAHLSPADTEAIEYILNKHRTDRPGPAAAREGMGA